VPFDRRGRLVAVYSTLHEAVMKGSTKPSSLAIKLYEALVLSLDHHSFHFQGCSHISKKVGGKLFNN